MNTVERFENTMAFKPIDRLPSLEWCDWWDLTLERWYAEGLPRELPDAAAIRQHLGLDNHRVWCFTSHRDTCPTPEKHGAALIRDTNDYQNIKKHLYPDPTPLKERTANWAAEQKRGQTVVWGALEGYFWGPRALLGIEPHLFAFSDQPALMHRINSNLLEWHLQLLEEVCPICTPNLMTVAEDMSYNHGPMLSKTMFDEFLAPYYRIIVPEMKKHGIIPFVDSDGNVTELIPWLEEVGFEGILPLERRSGVDVAQIRRHHPQLKMVGGFDKTVMHLGPQAMRCEFERLLPVMKQGGFIPSVDHQTPPDVSLAQYQCYVSLLGEYCEKAAR